MHHFQLPQSGARVERFGSDSRSILPMSELMASLRRAKRAFGKSLKEMRPIRRLTQEKPANRAGISPFTLRSYEQGKRMPRARQMEALCGAPSITEAALAKNYFDSPNPSDALPVHHREGGEPDARGRCGSGHQAADAG